MRFCTSPNIVAYQVNNTSSQKCIGAARSWFVQDLIVVDVLTLSNDFLISEENIVAKFFLNYSLR